jgi:hypothetical protein
LGIFLYWVRLWRIASLVVTTVVRFCFVLFA